eukprot:sb/3474809/
MHGSDWLFEMAANLKHRPAGAPNLDSETSAGWHDQCNSAFGRKGPDPSLTLSVTLSATLSVSLSLYLSFCLSLSISLSFYLSLPPLSLSLWGDLILIWGDLIIHVTCGRGVNGDLIRHPACYLLRDLILMTTI